jgi:ribonuclease P protein component
VLRLSKTIDIQKVFSQGKGVREQGILVKARETKNPTRVTVVVSKKTAKLATKRNRFKRLVREAVRHVPVREGFDIVFTVLPGVTMQTAQEAREVVQVALRKARLLQL